MKGRGSEAFLALLLVVACREQTSDTTSPSPAGALAENSGDIAAERSAAPDSELDAQDGPVPPGAGERAGSAQSQAEAEFLAWERKDPEDEARRLAWDAAHIGELLDAFRDLACIRLGLLREGRALLAGGGTAKAWAEFKTRHAQAANDWQHDVFRTFPDALQKSKAIGLLIAMHDWVGEDAPLAYEQQDRQRLAELESAWNELVAKLRAQAREAGRRLDESDAKMCAGGRGI